MAITFFVSAQQSPQPSACVLTTSSFGGDVIICSPTNLGSVNPCGTYTFIVTQYLPVPTGYAIVGKYEWFVNGVSVKTSTDPSDPILNWPIASNSTSVYCKVTYKKQDGSLSTPYQSTTFTPKVKDLNFNQAITTSTPPPNYGCTANTVSYSLNTLSCSGGGICDFVYSVSNYNITWQPPSGWVQTSISAKGNDVSFLLGTNFCQPL